MANAISMIFRINGNLYIIYCGKKEKYNNNKNDEENKKYKTNLIYNIKSFQKNCFLSNSSLITTFIFILLGNYIKKFIEHKLIIFKCGIFGLLGLLNATLIGLYEFKEIKNSIKKIKSL